jgi:hypothetical protein
VNNLQVKLSVQLISIQSNIHRGLRQALPLPPNPLIRFPLSLALVRPLPLDILNGKPSKSGHVNETEKEHDVSTNDEVTQKVTCDGLKQLMSPPFQFNVTNNVSLYGPLVKNPPVPLYVVLWGIDSGIVFP